VPIYPTVDEIMPMVTFEFVKAVVYGKVRYPDAEDSAIIPV
jgi:hypothetical protein